MALVSERSCQKRVMSLDLHSESAQRFWKFARYLLTDVCPACSSAEYDTIPTYGTYVRGSFPFPPSIPLNQKQRQGKGGGRVVLALHDNVHKERLNNS